MAGWGDRAVARFRERWTGSWILAADPTREREIMVEVDVAVRPSLTRWPVCAELVGVADVEGEFCGLSVVGTAELAKSALARGVSLRYRVRGAGLEITVERRLDPRDPYGSFTVLVGELRVRGVDARALLRADPRDR